MCQRCGRLIGMAAICPYCHKYQRKPKPWDGFSNTFHRTKQIWHRITPITPGAALIFKVTVVVFLIELIFTLIFAPSYIFSALWRGPPPAISITLGASTPKLLWWSPLTANFLHGGLIHLGMNMMGLYYIAPFIENLTSRSFFIASYLGSGAVGFLASSQIFGTLSLGASAAIFGLLGVGLAHSYLAGSSRHPMFRLFSGWVLFSLMFGFLVPGIDNAAHMGGLIGGSLWGLLWTRIRYLPLAAPLLSYSALILTTLTLVGWVFCLYTYLPDLITITRLNL